MSCVNTCECECISIDKISQCEEVLSFDLGVLNAELDLKFNITGRSKRIYQIEVTTDADGIADVNIENLPIGYLSVLFKGIYQVYFTNSENQKVEIRDTNKSCFEFQVLENINVIPNMPTSTPPDYSNQESFNINITDKGNGDTITHGFGFRFRIVSFYDSNDGSRQKNIFFASNQTTTTFLLNNDFDNDKYSGTLLCVKI